MMRAPFLLLAVFLLAGCGSSPRNGGDLQSALLDRGAVEFLQGNFNAAATHYERFLGLNPLTTRRVWIFTRIGLCRNGEGEYRAAIQAFDRALASGARGTSRVEILYRRAIAGNFSDLPGLALVDLEQVSLEPAALRGEVVKAAEFERIFGVTLIRAGNWKRGKRVLENLVRSWPYSPEAVSAHRILTFQKFSVQVALCPDLQSARKQIALLREQGVVGRAEILPDRSGVSVLVGEFSRYDQVVRERDRLRALGIPGFVLP